MKVAHLAAITPHRAGLYETARDLAAAERKFGIDARIVHPFQPAEDRGVPIGEDRFVDDADILVNHSGLGRYEKIDKPIVHVMHGRPRSSFLLEQAKQSPIYTMLRGMASDERFRAFVTFWPRFAQYWQLVLPKDRILTVTAPVDLNLWSPEGKSDHDFSGRISDVNVICVDPWRHDKDPFHMINAFWHFAAENPQAKLHLYGVTQSHGALVVLLQSLHAVGCLGEVRPFVDGIDIVYRSADLLITGHTVATRTVRESLACGCPVVAGSEETGAMGFANEENLKEYADTMAAVLRTDNRAWLRTHARAVAEEKFDSATTAREMVDIFESILGSG